MELLGAEVARTTRRNTNFVFFKITMQVSEELTRDTPSAINNGINGTIKILSGE
jgi:hypothetical protein